MKVLPVFLTCLLVGLQNVHGQLVISEILASNYEIEADEFGRHRINGHLVMARQ